MAFASDERRELAKHCSTRNWSKAIRMLDSFIAKSASIQDICNRAFCYSQLELHKHVIKDCDKALQLDPTLPQAYILKGNALSALGRKGDALLVLEKGYENIVRESTDLKQLLELEELLVTAKQNTTASCEEHVMVSFNAITSTPDTKAVPCEEQAMDSATTVTCNSFDTKYATCEDHAMDSSSTITFTSDGGCEIRSTSNGKIEYAQPIDPTKGCNRKNGTTKTGRKVVVINNPKTKSISLDFRLTRGITQVNEGNYDQAKLIFDQILRENPTHPEALIGRGTAYAFRRELNAAITDFTEAIKANPSAGEAWKRRGQARAVLGESLEAVEDLTKALEFEPNSSDILHERGIVSFKFKDYAAAVEDLTGCVSHDKKNKFAYTYLGMALSEIGHYLPAEEAHLKAIQLDPKFVEGWAHLAQYYQDLSNPQKAFHCLEQVLLVDVRFVKAYHLRGLLYHGMGQHRIAIKDLSHGLTIESSNVECLYLRASCYHAIGEYGDAVKDYNAVLDLELDSVDKFVLQCLAFYQKEIALYTASKGNSEFCWFDIDGDIDPLFKEYWCKRLHPEYVCKKVFRQPTLRDSLRKGRLRKQEFVVTKHKTTLLHAADLVGEKIQYNCPGFLSNRRQYRMAGLAAIEIAQKVSKAWRSLKYTNKNGKKLRKREKFSMPSQNRGGAGCSSSSLSEPSTSYAFTEEKSCGCSLSWQDIYSVAVKWRQISEPCDSVFWVNKLSEEFNSWFGSHTPIMHGQAKLVRYFPNYQRTLDVAKSIMMETKYVHNAEDNMIDLSQDGKLQKIVNAGSCSDLYDIVGENFWVATTCEGTGLEGNRLEGTRITFQKMDAKGIEFAIRTPCTPSRWGDYDAEMATAWEALCNAYCGEVFGSNDLSLLDRVKDSILRMTYYWYNFMPLSPRGTAVVGYTVLLGLFLAANMEVTTNIPPGIQVDWEAILSPNPNTFADPIKAWLYPSLRFTTSWKDYPDVSSTFSTTGSVVAALSYYEDDAV